MDISYNIVKLGAIVDDLHGVTGLGIALFDSEFNCLYTRSGESDPLCTLIQSTPEGRARCSCSDFWLVGECARGKSAVSHVCHAGLLDTAIPVFKSDRVVAYLVLGRIRTEETDRLAFDRYGVGSREAECYRAAPFYTKEQFVCLVDLISHILFESAVEIKNDDLVSRIVAYVDENIDKEITVAALCRATYVSRNRLYESVHAFFGCTVNQYINNKRISKAAKLLRESDVCVSAVAEAVGMGNYAYFSRCFKKKMGFSPREYRRLK